MPPRKPLPAVPKSVARAVARAATTAGLTAKQTKFAALVAAGAQQIAAYEAAYDAAPDSAGNSPESCRLAKHPSISLVIAEGRTHALMLTAEKGAKTREKISEYLDEALDVLHDEGDYATLAKVAKVAGEQVHVQAFAKRREAEEAASLTDFVTELRMLRREMVDQGLVIDVQPVAAVESGTEFLDELKSLKAEISDHAGDSGEA